MAGESQNQQRSKSSKATRGSDLRHNEPQYGAMRRERAPRWLPDEGQTLWRSLRGELVSLGLLTEVDEAAFNLMCFHYALAIKAGLQMVTDGLTVM